MEAMESTESHQWNQWGEVQSKRKKQKLQLRTVTLKNGMSHKRTNWSQLIAPKQFLSDCP